MNNDQITSKIINMPRDDYERAALLIEYYGTENVVRCPAGVFKFCGSKGIWKVLDEKQIKADLINLLRKIGETISRSRISNAVEIFKCHDYRDDVEFNQGSPNLLVFDGNYWTNDFGFWAYSTPKPSLMRLSHLPFKRTDQEPIQFEAFLDSVFSDNDGSRLKDRAELKTLIYEMIGYCMTSHTQWEKAFFLYGPGSNGKSVIAAILKAIIGAENIAAVPPRRMGDKFQASHMEGKLLNLVTELDQREQISDGTLKALISGETITVERKHQDPRNITPVAKHVFMTNHLPRFRDYSHGMHRRLLVIPMVRQFNGEHADTKLFDKLLLERDAIASKAMDALNALTKRNGIFTTCPSIEETNLLLRNENNTVALWAHNNLLTGRRLRDQSIELQIAHTSYKEWCHDKCHKYPVSNREFRKRLESLGFQCARYNNGIRILGVSLGKTPG